MAGGLCWLDAFESGATSEPGSGEAGIFLLFFCRGGLFNLASTTTGTTCSGAVCGTTFAVSTGGVISSFIGMALEMRGRDGLVFLFEDSRTGIRLFGSFDFAASTASAYSLVTSSTYELGTMSPGIAGGPRPLWRTFFVAFGTFGSLVS